MSKLQFDHLHEEMLSLTGDGLTPSQVARQLIQNHNLEVKENSLRMYICRNVERMKHRGLTNECEAVGVPMENVSNYWYKGKHYSINVKGAAQKTFFDLKDEVIAEMKGAAPVFPNIYYPKSTDGHLLIIDPADVHIGKLCRAFENGEEYNSQIAVQRVKEGVQGILNKAQGFHIDQILYIVGNDKLHVDTPKNTTTSGTYQDADVMWYDAFRIALQLDREIIQMLMQVAPVHVQYDPSNHDYQSGFFLAHALEAWFSNCEGVTFNVSIAHRKYYQYAKNLIGTTHGDGAKVQDLPLLMAQEAAKEWAECKHRYIYMHHIHHKMSKDFGSVCVEALRSPSGTDSWHHRNGYQHSPKAIEGFVHHKEHGQIARLTHIF